MRGALCQSVLVVGPSLLAGVLGGMGRWSVKKTICAQCVAVEADGWMDACDEKRVWSGGSVDGDGGGGGGVVVDDVCCSSDVVQ